MKHDVRDRVRRLARRARPDDEVAALRERVAVLETEVQECRALNARLAELTDVVTELLLPVAARDQDGVDAAIARYRAGI